MIPFRKLQHRIQMEQFRNPRNHDLHAHAKSEKCDHLVDDDRPVAAQLLHDPVALRKKKIEYEAHQDDDDGDHEVVDGAPHPVVFRAGRSHQRQDDRHAARTDADGKGDRIENLRLDRFEVDRLRAPVRRPADDGRIGVAEPRQRRAADQQTAAELHDRKRQIEQQQHEVSDRQTAQSDAQIIDQNPPDDGFAVRGVEPRQKTVHDEARSHGIRHGKQRHEGGYEHESETFL